MSSRSLARRASAPVLEVFASIQGEGAYVGEPQVFLRLRGCPLRCRWCDTPGSWTLAAEHEARIEGPTPRREPAWATPFQAACWIAEVERGAARTVSVTGGEPLAWPEFVLGLKPMIGTRRLHLETAGAHPRSLERVLAACDHVSLDLKHELDMDMPVELGELARDEPAGTLAASPRERAPRTAEEWRDARAACLGLVRGRDACAKIVVSGERAPEDFAELLDEVAEHAPELSVILQPVTPLREVPAAPRELVEALVRQAAERGLSLRVIPQVHRVLGLP